MQKEKWLNSLIFDTLLFDITILSEKEVLTVRGYLQDRKNPEEIAKEIGLSVENVRQIIGIGIGKILLTSKDLLAKKLWLQEIMNEKEILQNELAILRERFKKELADEKLTMEYERLNIPVTNLFLSTRVRHVLLNLKIRTVNDLQNLTLDELRAARNAGPKTVNEIQAKALEFGIAIVWEK